MRSVCQNKAFAQAGVLLTASNVLAGLCNYGFNLLMGGLLTAEDFLTFQVLIATTLVVGAPLAAGQTVATQYVATVAAAGSEAVIRRLFLRWTISSWCVGAVELLMVAMFAGPAQRWLQAPDRMSLWLLMLLVFLLVLSALNAAVFRGQQLFGWIAGSPLATAVLKIMFCSAAVGGMGWGVHGSLSGVALAMVLGVVVGSWRLLRSPMPYTEVYSYLPAFPYALVPPVVAAISGLATMTQIDEILVNRFVQTETASQYALATVLAKMLLYLPAGLAAAILPMVAVGHARGEQTGPSAAQMIFATLILSGAVALGCFLLCPWTVSLLYEQKYGAAGSLLAAYGPTMVPMALVIVVRGHLIARAWSLYFGCIAVVAVVEIVAINAWHPWAGRCWQLVPRLLMRDCYYWIN